MRRPTAIDLLSSAISVLLWRFSFLLISTNFFSHTPDSAGHPLMPGLADTGIYCLIALVMHLLLARRIATVRGWRFWLMPIVTVSVAAVMVHVLQWVPMIFRAVVDSGSPRAGQPPYMQTIHDEELRICLEVFGRSSYHILLMVPDAIFLTYPLLMAHQFLIRVLYRREVTNHPAQAAG